MMDCCSKERDRASPMRWTKPRATARFDWTKLNFDGPMVRLASIESIRTVKINIELERNLEVRRKELDSTRIRYVCEQSHFHRPGRPKAAFDDYSILAPGVNTYGPHN
jgi:hypothetical protein